MKSFASALLVAATLFSTAAFANEQVTLDFGKNNFKDISACGTHARAKAIVDNDGERVVRVCDAVNCTAGEVLINTNRNFEISGDGKTTSLDRIDAYKNHGDCSDIPLPYGYETVRIVIQSESGKTQGRITVRDIY